MHPAASDPTPNPVSIRPAESPVFGGRLPALVVFLATAGVLGVAYLLHPSARGIGTHQTLGLPPCGLEKATGVPCATCGMTTSFSYAAHGDLVSAFINQPAGAMLAVLTAMAAILSGYALVTGMDLAPIGRTLWRPKTVVVGAAVLIAAWVYKIVIHTGAFGVGA